MKPLIVIIVAVGVLLSAAYGALTYYDNFFKYGRMWETPAVKPHEDPIHIMEAGVIPFTGGDARFKAMAVDDLAPPPNLANAQAIISGKTGYSRYCVQCHGKYHDGNGTVGQSFFPLPGDLRSAKVQSMHPGQVFKEISFGIPGGRQPALATTIEVTDRWRIVAYVKSLGQRQD